MAARGARDPPGAPRASLLCLVLLLALSALATGGAAADASGVFEVRRKFTRHGGGGEGHLSALREHDGRRHGRVLAAIDLPLGGSGLATETGLYFTRIGIGTPAKRYYVQVDTGSDILWVNCVSCDECPRKSNLGIELTMYDPRGSQSGELVTCDQQFCVANYGGVLPSCTSTSPCEYSISYGDGSSTAGFFVTDFLQYNQVSGDGQTTAANASVTFGCGAKLGGDLGSSNLALDGILGFGQSNSSMLSQLAAAGKVQKMFAHCLDTVNGGGIFAIGNVVQPKVKTTPLVPDMYVSIFCQLVMFFFFCLFLYVPCLLCSTKTSKNIATIAGGMAHRRILLLAVVALAATAAVASTSSDFDDSNPIRSVTDHAASALESTVLAALGRTRDALRFARFAVRHGKSYEDAAEVQRRFRIFSESLELVRSTNRKGLPYRLGINRFADMSWEEFQASRLGAAQNCSATLAGNHRMRDSAALPETKDWREDGIVSPVKDQGHCGSCWTFSTTGSLEAAYTQATGKPVSLSEQQLVDCATAYNNFGCNGGLPSQAFEYIKYNGGLDTEEAYPYTGVNGICHYKPENVGVKVLDSVNITLGAEDELKNAVGLVRPVSVAFQVIDGFRMYKSGVYTSDHCGTSPMDVNHAVLAVGYGVENGVPYWLIKNSWGADWGDNGYFKMEMGKNMCGIATCASYPIVA